MRISRRYFIIICYGLIASCTSNPEFQREEVLSQELMPLRGITCPYFLEVKHPFLIIENYERQDSIFHIYDLNNYELKSAFGVKGRGPGEFLSPYLFSTQISDIYLEDGKDLVYIFGIDSSGQPVLKRTKQPNYVEGVLGATFINDSLYVRDGMFISPDLQLLTFEDELPIKSWQYRNPDIRNCFIDPDYGHVYANSNRVILCYHFKKQIDFMDIDLNIIKSVKFKYSPPEKITEQNQFDVKASYSFGYVGKHYLYVLFRDASWNEYKNPSYRGSILEVFDLDGNPIIQYHFNGIIPQTFVIDEETYKLYGRRDDGVPENNLIVYKLTGLS